MVRIWIGAVAFLVCLLPISLTTSCAHQSQEIAIQKPALDKNFDLKQYIQYHYENSYLKWIVNEEGIPVDEAERNRTTSLYPTIEAMTASIEADFNARFPNGANVEDFFSYMRAARASRCIYSNYKNIDGEKKPRNFSCNVDFGVPLPFSQKVFDRERIRKELLATERQWSDVDDYLRWQEEARIITNWSFSGALHPEDGSRIIRIRFELSS